MGFTVDQSITRTTKVHFTKRMWEDTIQRAMWLTMIDLRSTLTRRMWLKDSRLLRQSVSFEWPSLPPLPYSVVFSGWRSLRIATIKIKQNFASILAKPCQCHYQDLIIHGSWWSYSLWLTLMRRKRRKKKQRERERERENMLFQLRSIIQAE